MRPVSFRAVVGLWTVGVLCVACGGDSSTGTDDGGDELGHPPAGMVGTWTFQSATENGSPTSLADALDWDPATSEARLHIEANGSYYYEEVNSSGGQLWSEGGWLFVDPEGGTIVAHVQFDSDGSVSDQFDMEYTLSAGMLTLERVEGASTYVFMLTS